MPTYHVVWEIQIDANSPKEAAERALEIHRSPESIATVFKVGIWNHLAPDKIEMEKIDLLEDNEEEV